MGKKQVAQYEVTTLVCSPESRKLKKLLAAGWEVTAQKNRFGAPSTFTLRRQNPKWRPEMAA